MDWVCPMHPEVVRDQPGSCPLCGMAVERRTALVEEGPSAELVDLTRRFWVSSVLAGLTLVLAMGDRARWLQLECATVVVLWGGWPFFKRGWASLVNRRLNMFTLIALGTG